MTLLFRPFASANERIASVVLFAMLLLGGYGFFVSFLPSDNYKPVAFFVAVLLGFLAVLPFALWWGINRKIQGKLKKAAAYLTLYLLLTAVAGFASMYSAPSILTWMIGKNHQEEATVAKKATNRRTCAYMLSLREYNSSLCVSENEWKYTNVGDTVILKGQESIFGINVSHVERKQ